MQFGKLISGVCPSQSWNWDIRLEFRHIGLTWRLDQYNFLHPVQFIVPLLKLSDVICWLWFVSVALCTTIFTTCTCKRSRVLISATFANVRILCLAILNALAIFCPSLLSNCSKGSLVYLDMAGHRPRPTVLLSRAISVIAQTFRLRKIDGW